MTESIHGHEVMRMMLEAEKGWTRESLVAAIHERFGQEARFHTCSAEDLSASALIDFLESRKKFAPTAEGFQTDPSKICNHE